MTALRGLPTSAMSSHSRYVCGAGMKPLHGNLLSPNGSVSIRPKTERHSSNVSRHSGHSESLVQNHQPLGSHPSAAYNVSGGRRLHSARWPANYAALTGM